MKIIDTHIHSDCSFDGENTPREMALRALELGLTAITFAEHADVNDYYGDHYKHYLHFPRSAQIIPALKEEFAAKGLQIGFGVELGQYIQDYQLADELILKYDFDYIIGSTHNLKGREDFYYLDYCLPENEPNELMRVYFEETLEMAMTGDIDALGHLTYPLRYITGYNNIHVDLTQYTDIIHKILNVAVERGLGLEINTSGLRGRGGGKCFPDLPYVRMFREAGGEIVTIGSDAHRAGDLAAGFEEAAELVKAAGFTKIAYYKKRKPIFI